MTVNGDGGDVVPNRHTLAQPCTFSHWPVFLAARVGAERPTPQTPPTAILVASRGMWRVVGHGAAARGVGLSWPICAMRKPRIFVAIACVVRYGWR
jgi:hypothetical protein